MDAGRAAVGGLGVVAGVLAYTVLLGLWCGGRATGRDSGPQVMELLEHAQTNVLRKSTTLCCWVPIDSKHNPSVKLILNTWAKECDLFTFMTPWDHDDELKTMSHGYNMTESADLWNVVHRSWTVIYSDPTFEKCDWFAKADSDSYFGGQNFKRLVRTLNSSEPHYVGHVTYHHLPDLLVLGATIAISRGTMERLGPFLPASKRLENGKKQKKKKATCEDKVSWAEDVLFLHCLKRAGMGTPTLTYDSRGREHFFIQPISATLQATDDGSWMWKDAPSFIGRGLNYASTRPVTFHYIKLDRGMAYYFAYLEYYFRTLQVDPLLFSETSSISGKVPRC